MLNCRWKEDPVDPVRIVCDSRLRIPLESRIVQTAKDVPVMVAYRKDAADEEGNGEQRQAAQKAKLLADLGVELIPVNADEEGHVDLRELMKILGEKKIDSILLEGGGTLNWAALESGVVQQVQAYIAPKLFGGQEAKTPVEGAGVPVPSAAFRLKNSSLTHLGEDILIESEVEYPCSLEL